MGQRNGGRVQVRLPDGSHLSLDPRSRTEAGAFFHGVYDRDDIDFFKCCLDSDGTFLDIGANVGLISIPLGNFLKQSGRLLAFEPVPSNINALKTNLSLNGLCQMAEIFECALGVQNGTMKIGRECANGAGTGNAYLENSASMVKQPLAWTIVPVRKLDDIVAAHTLSRVDLIKMDVEGAELDVLRGAGHTLQRFRPIIYGEFQLTLRSAETFVDVAPILEGLDYSPFAFADRLDLVPVAFEPGRGNAVLCPNEKVSWLMERCRTRRDSDSRTG